MIAEKGAPLLCFLRPRFFTDFAAFLTLLRTFPEPWLSVREVNFCASSWQPFVFFPAASLHFVFLQSLTPVVSSKHFTDTLLCSLCRCPGTNLPERPFSPIAGASSTPITDFPGLPRHDGCEP